MLRPASEAKSLLQGLRERTTVADKILFSVLIIMSLSGIIFVREVLPKGRTVLIEVSGRPLYVLPIDRDRILSVDGPEGRTIVEIKGSRVRVADSPCRKKLCVRQGWIESGVIVCLPNSVMVTVGDHNDDTEIDKAVDAITG